MDFRAMRGSWYSLYHRYYIQGTSPPPSTRVLNTGLALPLPVLLATIIDSSAILDTDLGAAASEEGRELRRMLWAPH